MENKTIYQKMGAIMREINPIPKGQRNTQQGYDFRGIDDIFAELHNLFAKHGVFVLPNLLKEETEEREADYIKDGKTVKRVVRTSKALVQYFFVSESDGSEVSATSMGEAADYGDKASNKAQTFAIKNTLINIFLIPTKEKKDGDFDSYEYKPKQKTSSYSTTATTRQQPDLSEKLEKGKKLYKELYGKTSFKNDEAADYFRFSENWNVFDLGKMYKELEVYGKQQ